MWKIVQYFEGPGNKEFILENDIVSVGSGKNQDIVVGKSAEKEHFEIRGLNGKPYIIDLGTENGTIINNKKIKKKTYIKDGDTIEIKDEDNKIELNLIYEESNLQEEINTPFSLVGLNEKYKDVNIDIKWGYFLLGSHPDCKINIDDKGVSAHHCCFVYKRGYLYLIDLISTNGTYVNSEDIERKKLKNNDTIKIDKYRFKVSDERVSKHQGTEIHRAINDEDLADFTKNKSKKKKENKKERKTQIFKSVKKAKLVGLTDHFAGKTFNLESAIVRIGRAGENDIAINDLTVSDTNTVIEFHPNKTIVKDIKSTNGTYINDKKVRNKKEIENGDVLKIGGVEFRFIEG